MKFNNKPIDMQKPPERIVSLVPSQTELLYDLGLEKETVGITKFCIHPEKWFQSKTRVGGTKTVHIEKVKVLQPDLILANKEENTKEQVEALQAIAPVWVSDVHTLDDALDMIQAIGSMTHTNAKAVEIAREIATGFRQLHPKAIAQRALYLIWRRPWMTIGSDTFIHDIMQRIGLVNVFSDSLRYREISAEEMQERCPDIVLLSSEPYPFKEKHITELQSILPQAEIMLTDGEMFSWYGSRMRYAPDYFRQHFKC